MYVEPGTNIRLLKGVPLDPVHRNTLYFDTSAAQHDYFISKAVETFYNYTYQRVNNGVGRVSCPADRIYACNYMMFQNAAYGSKWFYALSRLSNMSTMQPQRSVLRSTFYRRGCSRCAWVSATLSARTP